jgi:hypothetical protein
MLLKLPRRNLLQLRFSLTPRSTTSITDMPRILSITMVPPQACMTINTSILSQVKAGVCLQRSKRKRNNKKSLWLDQLQLRDLFNTEREILSMLIQLLLQCTMTEISKRLIPLQENLTGNSPVAQRLNMMLLTPQRMPQLKSLPNTDITIITKDKILSMLIQPPLPCTMTVISKRPILLQVNSTGSLLVVQKLNTMLLLVERKLMPQLNLFIKEAITEET